MDYHSNACITKGDKSKSKKGRVVILVCDTSTGPVLHFCQVPSKYSKGYYSYRADEISISNKTKGDNYKSKKARVVVLVRNTSSGTKNFMKLMNKTEHEEHHR